MVRVLAACLVIGVLVSALFGIGAHVDAVGAGALNGAVGDRDGALEYIDVDEDNGKNDHGAHATHGVHVTSAHHGHEEVTSGVFDTKEHHESSLQACAEHCIDAVEERFDAPVPPLPPVFATVLLRWVGGVEIDDTENVVAWPELREGPPDHERHLTVQKRE